MKVEVTRTTKTKETVEVNLPYFYWIDVGDFVLTHGKIDEHRHRSITYSVDPRSGLRAVEINSEPTDWDTISCYLADEYKSNATEYEKAKQRAIEAAQDA